MSPRLQGPALAGVGVFLALPAAAAPDAEVIREEAFNYRILGELPAGWQRRPDTLVFFFEIEGVPHAYVHLFRQRLQGEIDVEAQVRRRETHYRFPGIPKEARGTIRKTDWGGRPAVEYRLETTVQGVRSVRRVTALFVKSVWYERIETIYGEKTEEEDACRRGLRLFERGFRLLAEPLREREKTDAEAATIVRPDYGFTLVKPRGFLRAEVDPAQDPGIRVALEARAGDPKKRVRIRLFEYGVRAGFEPPKWMDAFFNSFSTLHAQARRTALEAPALAGAHGVVAERFTGRRDDVEIQTDVHLFHSAAGRVFCLRIRTQGGADIDFKAAIDEFYARFRLTDGPG